MQLQGILIKKLRYYVIFISLSNIHSQKYITGTGYKYQTI